MKPVTWEDALKLNGTEGYTARDALESREKELQARRQGSAAVRRSWAILGREERSCEKHGAFQSQLEQLDPAPKHPMFAPRWTTCPTCDQEIEAEERAKSPASAEMKRVMEKMRLVHAGLPEMYLDTDWRGYHRIGDYDKMQKQGENYARDFQSNVEIGKNLVLLGNPGTGKTMMGCIILRLVMMKLGATGKYMTQARLVSRIKTTMDSDRRTETEEQVYNELASVDLLFLDEIGRGSASEWEKACVFRVIDERYQRRCKPTILASNFTEKGLEEFLSKAAIDRLKCRQSILLRFTGPSLRAGDRGKNDD